MVKGILLLLPTFMLVMLVLSTRCGIRGRKGHMAEFASIKAQEFEADHNRLLTEEELKAVLKSEPNINLEPDDHILIFWASDKTLKQFLGIKA